MSVRGYPKNPNLVSAMAEVDWSVEVDRLSDAFSAGGGLSDESGKLYMRTDLQDASFGKLEAGEPVERFREMDEHTLAAGDLVLYEVRMKGGGSKGLAVERILDLHKQSKLEYTAKLKFLAAEDSDYAAWARESFNEKQDCRLHFCSGPMGDCRVKSRSKSVGLSHTDSWRLCSYRSVIRSPWASAAILEDLSVMVSRWLRDNGERVVERAGDELPHPLDGEGDGVRLDEEFEEPRESRKARKRDSPPPEVPRDEREADRRDEREHQMAQDAGRKAMVALRGRSPQLMPGVAGASGESLDRRGGRRVDDPPKPAAVSPKVTLVAAEGRGREPWMDDVSVQDGQGGHPSAEQPRAEEARKRKRESSRRREAPEDRRPAPGGDVGRGDFLGGDKKAKEEKEG